MTLAPVLFQIFNRPEQTARTFAAIREVRPHKLLIVADGPRPGRIGEEELCEKTRAIAQAVDWPCEVSLNISDVNMGCGRRVSSGLDWAFTQVESLIIIEDDCAADPSFFRFCSELLERYRYDERIMMISGNNFQNGQTRTPDSYFFSRFPHCWGWATWHRAWRHYDFAMGGWEERRASGWLKSIVGSSYVEKHWTSCFDATLTGRIDTWDYQWLFCMLSRNGLSIVPSVNLVANIGLGESATHTKELDRRYIVPVKPIEFPLRHPEAVAPFDAADEFEKRYLYNAGGLNRGAPVRALRQCLEFTRLWPHARALKSWLNNRTRSLARSRIWKK